MGNLCVSVSRAKYFVNQPSADRAVELVQFAGKKVIGFVHYHEAVVAGP